MPYRREGNMPYRREGGVSYGRDSPQNVRSLRERSWESQERLAYGEPRKGSPVATHMTQPSVRFTRGHSPYIQIGDIMTSLNCM